MLESRTARDNFAPRRRPPKLPDQGESRNCWTRKIGKLAGRPRLETFVPTWPTPHPRVPVRPDRHWTGPAAHTQRIRQQRCAPGRSLAYFAPDLVPPCSAGGQDTRPDVRRDRRSPATRPMAGNDRRAGELAWSELVHQWPHVAQGLLTIGLADLTSMQEPARRPGHSRPLWPAVPHDVGCPPRWNRDLTFEARSSPARPAAQRLPHIARERLSAHSSTLKRT